MITPELLAALYSPLALAAFLLALPLLAGVKRWQAERERLQNMRPYLGEEIPGRPDRE